ncbi:SH3 domain-containing protein [Halolactibacillus alkaliphilus]|nr:SH3 domain-containing protein [Halolactibacillus alkaliphilus]
MKPMRKIVFVLLVLFFFIDPVIPKKINNTDNLYQINAQEVLRGIALKDRTAVYSEKSTDSDILRQYNQGRVLLYRDSSKNWYEAYVIINGEGQTGYIHRNDVETLDLSNQLILRGIATTRVDVYKEASRSSTIHRSYREGSSLIYKTYSNNWYEAYVIVNGVGHTGFIHKDDVENIDLSNQQLLRGIALDNVKVHSNPAQSSSTLRTYREGSVLQYKTFSSEWYEAYVIINGIGRTGYIHKNDVDNIENTSSESLRGVALNNTSVYSRASTNAPVLRSYSQGHLLYYRTFSTNWYEAIVILNGTPRTGYINARDVETISSEQIDYTGYADSSPTRVYSRASRDSKVLRSYNKGQFLYFKSFSSSWYEAMVIINGKRTTGYIHKSDVTFEPVRQVKTTNYNIRFSNFVDIQMTRTPKANGTGTILASRPLVEYYANPSNFRENEVGFYQFLDLSTPAGLNATEVNNNVLNSRTGSLANTAGAFIEAGNRYGINEAYLIAHALHETGNGTSQLARGVKVNGRTVYNVYGIAAYDNSAVTSGSQHAYNQKWFTPEAAIIGGAKFVAQNYIHRGQDTLYKMRWNPANPGVHQYATHVAWAQIPTQRISRIYDSLQSYVQTFDVPKFNNQPGFQGATPPQNTIESSNYPNGAIGLTTGSNVRFRSEPSTVSNQTIIATIRSVNTKLDILGTNNQGWYQAGFEGKTGWISEDFVKLSNVLQVTASSLNVRLDPSTRNPSQGRLSNGDFVLMVLDDDSKPVTHEEWYKIHYQGKELWISSGPNSNYIKIQ